MRFTHENTDGFTDDELSEVNAYWEAISAEIGEQDDDDATAKQFDDLLTRKSFAGGIIDWDAICTGMGVSIDDVQKRIPLLDWPEDPGAMR